jgi:hypothetical protein
MKELLEMCAKLKDGTVSDKQVIEEFGWEYLHKLQKLQEYIDMGYINT